MGCGREVGDALRFAQAEAWRLRSLRPRVRLRVDEPVVRPQLDSPEVLLRGPPAARQRLDRLVRLRGRVLEWSVLLGGRTAVSRTNPGESRRQGQ